MDKDEAAEWDDVRVSMKKKEKKRSCNEMAAVEKRSWDVDLNLLMQTSEILNCC